MSNDAITHVAKIASTVSAVAVGIGDILAGKYRVAEVVGCGGTSLIVGATHGEHNERVAIKLLLPAAAENPEFSGRFAREMEITAKLTSEHVARVMDVGKLESGAPYMVMEYLVGQDLRRVLKANGPLPVSKAIDYVVQACAGIAEAHAQGVIHRDLKPSNLFLTKRADGVDLIKVLDFGVSKGFSAGKAAQDLTNTGAVLGSPRYMSPEQLTDASAVDARSDVWSLATILYELLAGEPPFAGRTQAVICARVLGSAPPPSLVERRGDVDPKLEAAIFRALERDNDRRTSNVALFARDVVNAVQTDRDVVSRGAVERVRAMMAVDDGAGAVEGGKIRKVQSGLFQRMTSAAPADEKTSGAGTTAPVRPAGGAVRLRIVAGCIAVLVLGALVSIMLPKQQRHSVAAVGASGEPSSVVISGAAARDEPFTTLSSAVASASSTGTPARDDRSERAIPASSASARPQTASDRGQGQR